MKLTPANYSITKTPAKETLKLWIEAMEKTGSMHDSISIAGLVKDNKESIVKNAFVQVMDEHYNSIIHGFTNDEGKYLINNVPANLKYNILVTADGKKTLHYHDFQGDFNEVKIVNFTLEHLEDKDYSIIAGNIVESENIKNNITGAIITLNILDDELNEKLMDVTYTNENGQYIFTDLQPGNYNISISASGYLNKVINKEVLSTGTIIPFTIMLEKDKKIIKGSAISGVVKDYNENPLGNTDVILYSIGEDNLLTPISFTKSNDKGMYLFINVPKGNYKVMCKKDDIVTTD